jgi:hypothetical protein
MRSLSALAGNFSLLRLVHGGKTALGRSAWTALRLLALAFVLIALMRTHDPSPFA